MTQVSQLGIKGLNSLRGEELVKINPLDASKLGIAMEIKLSDLSSGRGISKGENN
jgi:hypothetical protein